MVREFEDAASWEATPATPARARVFVERLVRQCSRPELIPTATLLTSEMVTNAVVHVGGIVDLRVSCRLDRVRVEVRDTSGRLPVTGDPAHATTSGRGLHLLDALADAWGSGRDGAGKVMWFELNADE